MSVLDLKSLNPPQREAVLKTEGPVLIFAGAGSGKTRVLTYRIAHLIADKGVLPANILAITFTNKAAKEMRERLSSLLGHAADAVWVSTFHAMCAKILRRDIEKLGYTRQFSIYDDDDSLRVIKDALKALNLSDKLYAPREIRYIISDCKNRMLSASDFLASSRRDFRAQKIHDLFVWYEKALKQNNALDFDDLLIKTLELFVQHPPVLDYYRQRFHYIHVDEYQDTNMPQYQLVHLLSGYHNNVCVVGDDDQSIYSWRGADIRNILEFEKDYPGAASIKLEQNYRSTGHILSAANGVIGHNQGRKSKRLWTDKPLGEPVFDVAVRDEHHEARYVVEDILKQLASGAKGGDCAVLYRVNAQSRVMEEHLVQSGIPYRVYGGLRFYDRAEVKDILAYMRLISNPDDGASLLRIINTPRRAIGDSTVAYLQQCANQLSESLCSVVMDVDASAPDLKARAKDAVVRFAQLVLDLMAKKEVLSVGEFAKAIVADTGYLTQYEGKTDDESVAKVQNVREFLGSVEKYEQDTPDATLESFLENVALVSAGEEQDDAVSARVALLTVHAAKGLEFKYVYVLGMEDGVFPGARSMTEPDKLEEERRLCYVAITRAEKQCVLLHARTRMLFGSSQYNRPSRFLREISARDKQELDLSTDTRGANRSIGRSTGNDFFASSGGSGGRNFAGSDFGLSSTPKRTAPVSEKPRTARPMGDIHAKPAQVYVSFTVGERVSHPTFGNGTVISVAGSGAGMRVDVAFENRGVKKLVASIAPLTKLE